MLGDHDDEIDTADLKPSQPLVAHPFSAADLREYDERNAPYDGGQDY